MPVLLPFQTEHGPALYGYRQRFEGTCRLGVTGLLNRTEARLLLHEETLRNRRDFRPEGSLWIWCDTRIPLRDIPDDGTNYQIWPLTDPHHISELQEAFRGRELFLADGHHRYAAGWNVATIQSRDPSLRSRPSHRVAWETRALRVPQTQPVSNIEAFLSSTPEGRWRAVVIRRGSQPGGFEIPRELPITSLFQDAVVEPVGTMEDAVEAVAGGAPLAMLVSAYTLDQIEWYARRRILLPPKSTDFVPKLHLFQKESIAPATAQRLGVR